MERVALGQNILAVDRLRALDIKWRTPVLLIHLAILSVASILMISLPVGRLSSDALLSGLAVVQLGMLAWILFSWRLVSGTILNPFGLFLLATGAFHCSVSFLIIAGQQDSMALVGELSTLTLCRTLLAVTISLGMLYLGALAASSQSKEAFAEIQKDRSFLTPTGLFFLALSAPGIGASFAVMLDAVGTGGYIALFQDSARVGAVNTLLGLSESFFLVGAMMLIVGRNHIGRVLGLVVVVIRSAVFLYLGYRAYALLPLVAVVWLVHTTNHRLPLKTVGVAGLLTLFVVGPLVRGVRDTVGLDRWSISNIIETWRSLENPFTALLSDMGSSVLTVAYTLELVPATRPFELGLGYLRALSNAIPVFDWTSSYGYASSWLAWAIKPEWASGGFGFGYSFIAESFLNFGWLGVVIMSLAIGFAIVKMSEWVRANPLRAVVVAVFLPSLLFFSRGESIDLIRPLLWQALLPCAFIWFLRQINRRDRWRGWNDE